jgi:transcription initiation factor TFIID subunit TAF12
MPKMNFSLNLIDELCNDPCMAIEACARPSSNCRMRNTKHALDIVLNEHESMNSNIARTNIHIYVSADPRTRHIERKC